MDWTLIISIFAVIVTNLSTVIALYLHLDKKMEESRKDTHSILMAIQQEMKDFHGRLCTIEERNRR